MGNKIETPLIVGARGNMGRRYRAIMREWFCDPLEMDVGDEVPEGFDGVIIATPTPTHAALIEKFIPYGKPILCEKPICTDRAELERLLGMAEAAGVRLDMVNQYRFCNTHMADVPNSRTSHYSYYNHGKDGLAWDCISILALADGPVWLSENTARWSCIINGRRLLLESMDWAYITMIGKWMTGDLVGHGPEYIRMAHDKVRAYLEAHP